MNMKTITSAIIAAVIGFTLSMPATTLAGDRDHRRHDSGRHESHQNRHSKQQRRHSNRHNKQYSKRHSNRHNKQYSKRHSSRHNKQYSKRHYKGHNRHNYNRRHYSHGGYGGGYYNYDDDDDEKLLYGLIIGGILGYALNEGRHNDGDYYDQSYQRNDYPATGSYSNSSCLQEREYQTTVIVGGRNVDAYGTACLQPDGSWKRNPPAVASY
jgi:hypothetical protein